MTRELYPRRKTMVLGRGVRKSTGVDQLCVGEKEMKSHFYDL
jgi:hypothetical protein